MKNYCLIIFGLLLSTSCEKMLVGPEPENSPAGSFDVLWKGVDEKYGLFPVSNLNWDSLYTVYRDQINKSTTDNDLWNICCGLLSHLNNGHVEFTDKNFSRGYSPVTCTYDRNTVNPDLIKNRYLLNPRVTGEGFITYGYIKNSNLGYICIRSFHGAANGRDWIRDMDQVIRELYGCDGIILDVRNNGGGFTRNDLYAASFFIKEKITYYYSRQKTGTGHNDFGDPMAKIIYPRNDTLKYVKKNVVLTNRYSASGAEAFTLILSYLPYSTQIGDTTRGAFGEVSHEILMPNGWILFYPCTLTTLADGSSPEGVGLVPDIVINNTVDDVNAGRDKVVEQAIDYLSGQQ